MDGTWRGAGGGGYRAAWAGLAAARGWEACSSESKMRRRAGWRRHNLVVVMREGGDGWVRLEDEENREKGSEQSYGGGALAMVVMNSAGEGVQVLARCMEE